MIKLTIYVDDIDAIIAMYTHIRIYTSDEEEGTYTHLAYVSLVDGQSTYTYNHTDGDTDTWYKSSYWSTLSESSLSDPAQGTAPKLYHSPTYPPEYDFNADEKALIRRIRRNIGDLKGLERLYRENESDDDYCSSIKDDNKTVELGEKGWPVYISLASIEKDSLTDPYVQGYKWLTFSGTLNSSSYPMNIWHYTFKFSDVEIYRAYDEALMPAGLTSDTVTKDHLILVASIDLLESMSWEDMVEDGARITDDQSSYDPSPGLRERDAAIKRLKKRLDDLIEQYKLAGIDGVLID